MGFQYKQISIEEPCSFDGPCLLQALTRDPVRLNAHAHRRLCPALPLQHAGIDVASRRLHRRRAVPVVVPLEDRIANPRLVARINVDQSIAFETTFVGLNLAPGRIQGGGGRDRVLHNGELQRDGVTWRQTINRYVVADPLETTPLFADATLYLLPVDPRWYSHGHSRRFLITYHNSAFVGQVAVYVEPL